MFLEWLSPLIKAGLTDIYWNIKTEVLFKGFIECANMQTLTAKKKTIERRLGVGR